VCEVAGKEERGGVDGASNGFFGSREFGGFLERVTMICVSSLHLFRHSGWSLRKKKQLNIWNLGPLSLLFTKHI
jgi:hypothetical protein